MLKSVVAIAVLVLAGCERAPFAPPPDPRVKVVATYLEIPPRDHDDWRTVLVMTDGMRIVVKGKLGEPGEEFTIPSSTMRVAP